MRFTALAAAAATGLVVLATPVAAQDAGAFTGPRIGATLGYDDIRDRNGLTYGGAVGYDLALAPRITLGAEATLEDSTAKGTRFDASRDVALSARAGYVLAPRLLAFAKVGYDSTRFDLGIDRDRHTNLEGVRYGGGLELSLTRHTYLSAEYRRTSYEDNARSRDAGIAGFGIRF